ncbi:MAG: hypothetical protein N2441_11140, partial [Rhodocyclaceae bacterium]|nr:hypothetical protein [Rhodocyclaceae bacterium]
VFFAAGFAAAFAVVFFAAGFAAAFAVVFFAAGFAAAFAVVFFAAGFAAAFAVVFFAADGVAVAFLAVDFLAFASSAMIDLLGKFKNEAVLDYRAIHYSTMLNSESHEFIYFHGLSFGFVSVNYPRPP